MFPHLLYSPDLIPTKLDDLVMKSHKMSQDLQRQEASKAMMKSMNKALKNQIVKLEKTLFQELFLSLLRF